MKKVERSEDRISGLPDAVLGHILSYLPTEESVRTSILSKRWSSLWSSVPVLDINDFRLSSEHAIRSSFIEYVNKVLNPQRAAATLQKLTLRCSKLDSPQFNKWVMSAMGCKVKELNLRIYDRGDFEVCDCLFAYHYLVALKLGRDFFLDIPEKALLPSLKKLHLVCLEFSDDESFHNLLSGCPILEYLNMERCFMVEEENTFQITSYTLKFLLLDYCYECRVVVDAPCLEFLRYTCHIAKRSSFKNLDSLNEAYINVEMPDFDESKISDMREIFIQLVNDVANAKIITFTSDTQEVLSLLKLATFPVHNGMTKLVLQNYLSFGMLLPKFLESAPCLQDLVLDPENPNSPSEFEWHDPIQVPRCLLDSLKSVKILGFNGESSVLKFIKYLVANAKVLVKLSVDNKNEEHKELKVGKKLINLLLEK